MDTQFWRSRWENNEIGFHQAEFNSHLLKAWPKLNIALGSRIFVPLCGKSRDMLWLASEGYKVSGVETSELAISAFFSETQLQPERDKQGDFERWRHDELQILCGDFFKLTKTELSDVDAVYDRASLVAMPPEMRVEYATHMANILPKGCKILLITFDYPQDEMSGPPFAVNVNEVNALYEGAFTISPLYSQDVLEENARFKERGVSRIEEHIFILTKKSSI